MALDSSDKSRPAGKAKPLRVIDLCTGTGCISLLLHALLAPHFQKLSITGIDISSIALSLAQENLKHNLQLGQLTCRASTDIHFQRGNVLGNGSDDTVPSIDSILQTYHQELGSLSADQIGGCDLLISNPPYISQHEFGNGTTARSVRLFEPKLALVPPSLATGEELDRPEDVFYHRILALMFKLNAKITVLECGDIVQAQRVLALHETLAATESDQFNTEVWPSTERDLAENGFHATDGSRAVIIRRLP
jgi:methylase of polypeptide subunit release factors